MITGPQIRAARALLGIDQRELARLSGLSVPTIQRMEACEGSVRAVVDSLEKVMAAIADAGVELIVESAASHGVGHGVRLLQKRSGEG
ncbi:MAG: helix-turn-helix domain-containing protein [Caulobacteraceae bacterium]|nr:helix-turn-helix domain-containing protein [Caulobacteraceae bacterium]